MGFVFERFFVYAEIDACENFPYVDAFETAIFLFLIFLVGSKRLETILMYVFSFKQKRKKTTPGDLIRIIVI